MTTTDQAPKVSESDIERWRKLICERPEGPWVMGNGGSFDRTKIKPISDEMLLELALWLRLGYTPWNSRSMPLSAGDRQFMYLLYYSVQGLISRMRAAEKAAAKAQDQAASPAAGTAQSLTPSISLKWDHDGQGGYYVEMRVNALLSEDHAHAAMAYMERLFCGGELQPN